MASKRKSSIPLSIKIKKQRSVMTLQEKMEVLNLLKDGMSVGRVACMYGRNESSIRQKALSLYAHYAQSDKGSGKKAFKASHGWLNSFKKRFNLINRRATPKSTNAYDNSFNESGNPAIQNLRNVDEIKALMKKQKTNLDIRKLSEVLLVAKHLKDVIFDNDPLMERSLKVIRGVSQSLLPYQEMFNDLNTKNNSA